MRIKISGEITVEKLVLALANLQEHLGDSFNGFFRGNIYLTPFDKNGQSMDALDQFGASIIFEDGEPSAPIVTYVPTARAVETLYPTVPDLTLVPKRKIDYEANALVLKQCIIERDTYKNLGRCIADFDDATQQWIERDVETFLNLMDGVIADVWHEFSPVYQKSNNSGLPRPRPQPCFKWQDQRLLLCNDATGRIYRKVTNPVWRSQTIWDYPQYHWPNDVWVEAAQRISCLILPTLPI